MDDLTYMFVTNNDIIGQVSILSECGISKAHKSDVNSCSVSKSGLIATASGDRSVCLWKLSSKEGRLTQVESLSGHSYGVNYCCFSPQGTLLASCSTDSSTIVWDVASRSQLATFLQPSGSGVRVCQFCPESPFLATAGDDDQVCIWDLAQKQLVRNIESHDATIFALAFSPEGSVLVSTDTEGRMKVWAALAHHHSPLASQEVAHDLGVTSSAFSPSFTSSALQTKLHLATTGQDGLLMLWNIQTGSSTSVALAHRVFAHEGCAMCVNWSFSGEMLATAGGDKMVRVWQLDQVAGFTCQALLSGHTRFVTSCCFSNNADFVISGSNDRTVRVWRLKDGPGGENPDPEDAGPAYDGQSRQENRFQASLTRQQEKVGKPVRLDGHTSDVNSCAFNGLLLATGSADKTVRVWELGAVSSWSEMDFSPLLGHSYSVYSVAFPSEDRIVSASLDGSIIVWDSKTGVQVRRHDHPHSTGFRSVTADPLGKTVAAGEIEDSLAQSGHLSIHPSTNAFIDSLLFTLIIPFVQVATMTVAIYSPSVVPVLNFLFIQTPSLPRRSRATATFWRSAALEKFCVSGTSPVLETTPCQQLPQKGKNRHCCFLKRRSTILEFFVALFSPTQIRRMATPWSQEEMMRSSRSGRLDLEAGGRKCRWSRHCASTVGRS